MPHPVGGDFHAEGNRSEELWDDSKMRRTENSSCVRASLHCFSPVTVRSHHSHNNLLFSVWKSLFFLAWGDLGDHASLLIRSVGRRENICKGV